MKRTFIPPENRPDIKGATLRSANSHYLRTFNNNRKRKQFIADLVSGKQIIPDIDMGVVAKILKETFEMQK